MREKREKRAGRGPSPRAPRVSLAPKTAFPFPFIRLPRRLDQTVKKLIAFRSRKFIACHSKLSILNNAGVMWCAKESRMRVLMQITTTTESFVAHFIAFLLLEIVAGQIFSKGVNLLFKESNVNSEIGSGFFPKMLPFVVSVTVSGLVRISKTRYH